MAKVEGIVKAVKDGANYGLEAVKKFGLWRGLGVAAGITAIVGTVIYLGKDDESEEAIEVQAEEVPVTDEPAPEEAPVEIDITEAE